MKTPWGSNEPTKRSLMSGFGLGYKVGLGPTLSVLRRALGPRARNPSLMRDHENCSLYGKLMNTSSYTNGDHSWISHEEPRGKVPNPSWRFFSSWKPP